MKITIANNVVIVLKYRLLCDYTQETISIGKLNSIKILEIMSLMINRNYRRNFAAITRIISTWS